MIVDEDVYLEHYGKKGMRWGVRNNNRGGISRRTDREASKDAKEFARAKLFYGEGAGTRRKLIKNTVEAKKKRDPSYAKAFDKHLDSQDLSKHAEKARSERSRKDKAKATKQVGGAVARRFTGEMGTNAAFMSVAIGGAAFMKSPKGQALTAKTIKTVKNYRNTQAAKNTTKFLKDYLSRQGA